VESLAFGTFIKFPPGQSPSNLKAFFEIEMRRLNCFYWDAGRTLTAQIQIRGNDEV
jgi:hypothetical protein